MAQGRSCFYDMWTCILIGRPQQAVWHQLSQQADWHQLSQHADWHQLFTACRLATFVMFLRLLDYTVMSFQYQSQHHIRSSNKPSTMERCLGLRFKSFRLPSLPFALSPWPVSLQRYRELPLVSARLSGQGMQCEFCRQMARSLNETYICPNELVPNTGWHQIYLRLENPCHAPSKGGTLWLWRACACCRVACRCNGRGQGGGAGGHRRMGTVVHRSAVLWCLG